jgi:hypothetical protein
MRKAVNKFRRDHLSSFIVTQPPKARNKKAPFGAFYLLAEWTGLEPATPGVTGRYSNQLNYHSNEQKYCLYIISNSPQTRKSAGGC